MESNPKNLHFIPTTTSCYICGKSRAEFKDFFNFASHRMEYAAQTGTAGRETEAAIAHDYEKFLDHYSANFFEFYRQIMQLPTPLDNLPYRTIKSEREQQKLQKMFPELEGFDYNQLNTWGITQIPAKSWAKAMRGGEGNTIREFKTFCTQVFNDFTNQVVNRSIIWIITQWYVDRENVDADGHLVKKLIKPAFLEPLNENLKKLEEIIQSHQPEIEFSESKFTQTAKNQETIIYAYHLCPVCRHICKSS